jgi:Phage protein
LLRVSERTVHNWERGRVGIPYAAYKLMRILRGYELPNDHWEGYRLVGDTLWSPEGLAFKACQQRWWSLTCRMASEFRHIMAGRRTIQPPQAAPALAVGQPRKVEEAGLVHYSTTHTRSPGPMTAEPPAMAAEAGAGAVVELLASFDRSRALRQRPGVSA